LRTRSIACFRQSAIAGIPSCFRRSVIDPILPFLRRVRGLKSILDSHTEPILHLRCLLTPTSNATFSVSVCSVW
jgi:hypothetical protein